MTLQPTLSPRDRTTWSPFDAWRAVASLLLLVILVWFSLYTTVGGEAGRHSSSLPFALSCLMSVEDGSPADYITLASEAFTLTVLSTNDTWGYLDPCG